MSFLSFGEPVDKPCKDVLAYPLQCFQELFLATPGIVGTFFLGIGGFFVAVLIWGAIFASVVFALYKLLVVLCKVGKHFFTNTKIGQKIASSAHTIAKHLPGQKFFFLFCKAKGIAEEAAKPKKLINTKAITDYGANIVSKVHVETKWFKNALKHVPFTKSSEIDNPNGHAQESNNVDSSHSDSKSPAKALQRSTSRLSGFAPRILLSPKSQKH